MNRPCDHQPKCQIPFHHSQSGVNVLHHSTKLMDVHPPEGDMDIVVTKKIYLLPVTNDPHCS